ncbi:DNA-binding protein [Penguinpox virus]|uniref:DNA-binding protein n=1 Tax=Penguinpox virus TaxID=648998 RepID=A0A068ELG5_9POXV|nr:DNA-binding protein [Penguinpox virus]AID46822.1 DNA-binding protein [Penguinpox virus]
MDNFLKQISSNVKKPIAELEDPDAVIKFYYMNISFNFPDLYYCNNNLFDKPENSLLDISKSLLMLNSFSHECFILQDLLRVIRRYGHVYDVYFLPIGWLVGNGESPKYHASIKLIRSNTQEIIDGIVRRQLSQYGIQGDNLLISVDSSNEVSINRHSIIGARQLQPVCVVSFYPFDPEHKVFFVIYVGRYKDKYCGISYVADREDMYKVINRIYPYVSCFYLVSDGIINFHTTPVANHTRNIKPLPVNHCNTLCEIIYDFEYLKFDQGVMSIPVFMPFVPKQFVSIINLPDDIPITCTASNNIEYITHIDNKKLKRILIIIKDKFLKDTIMQGTFKKVNLVRHKKYTYTITYSSFDCPKLENTKSSSPSTCNKAILDGRRYVTKTFNVTI